MFFSFRILFHNDQEIGVQSSQSSSNYKLLGANVEKQISGVGGVGKDLAGSTSEVSIIGSSKCMLLQLDLYHVGVGQYMKDLGKLQCASPFYSKLRHMSLVVEGKGIRELAYRAILPPKGESESTAGFELGERNGLSSSNGRLDRGSVLFSILKPQ